MSLNEIVLVIFFFAILVYSIIIHEVMHGYAALLLGDPTAKYAGRLNLNPLKHIDPWGSILVPLIMIMTLGVGFGWAKPVPYNPYNLKDQKWGPAMVAMSGPGSNLLLAILAGIFARLIAIPAALKVSIISNVTNARWGEVASLISGSLGSILFVIFTIIIFWNVVLAFFNLIPIPPLDGSKLLFAVLSVKTETMIMLEQFGFLILLAFIFLFSPLLGAFLNFMMNLFLGIAV